MSHTKSDELVALRSSPLWQAVLKIEWAEYQFAWAQTIVNRYIAENRFGIREDFDANGHRLILFAERLDKMVPILIGSGIHALRSVLDTTISLLVEGVSKKKLDRVNFPFYESERQFRASFEQSVSYCGQCGYSQQTDARQKEILHYIPELKSILVDELKPWKEGNYSLWALNRLDNFQKHRALLLAFVAASASIGFATPEGWSATGCLWIVSPGQELEIARSRTQIMVSRSPMLSIKATLPDELPFGGKPLFDVLHQLHGEVHKTLLLLYSRFKDHEALSDW